LYKISSFLANPTNCNLSFKFVLFKISTTLDNCPFHQSIIIKSGIKFDFSISKILLSIISLIELKSSIFHSSKFLILNFLYLEFAVFQFSITDLLATV